MQDQELDLSTLDTSRGAEEGFELQLVNPKTGDPLPIWITVSGVDSEAYQAAIRDRQRRQFKAMAQSRKFTLTPEEIEANALDLLVVATRGWRGAKGKTILLAGEDLAPGTENFRKVYKQFAWIREQVDAAISDRANFLPGGSTS